MSDQGKRFDLYSSGDNANLYQLGLKIHPEEEELEFKRKIQENETDSVFIYGGNSQGDRLVVRVSRRADGLTSSWLVLRLANGSEYKLPKEHLHVEPKTIPETFVAGGLRIKCLTPMRRWRISFNGFLKKTNADLLEHVKFSFIWNASSDPNDLKDDFGKETLAKYLAKQSLQKPSIDSLTKYLDEYVQVGFLFGTVQFGQEDETEIYLWGPRKRSIEIFDATSPIRHTEYFTYSKEGEFMHYGQVKYPTLKSELEHGFVIRSNGLGGTCQKCRNVCKENGCEDVILNRDKFKIVTALKIDEINKIELSNGDPLNGQATLHFPDVVVNGNDIGHGVIIQYQKAENFQIAELSKPRIHLPQTSLEQSLKYVLPLTEEECRNVALTGGKGSSLAELTLLSQQSPIPFQVPKGIVVTSTAYAKFMTECDLLQVATSVEDIAWVKEPNNLQQACDMAMSVIQQKILPRRIQEEITKSLEKIFESSVESSKFAVRSSAAGEDSEELSAAGQMTTYLGVQGLENIKNAVVKCWASQFSFVAAQYKRQNGQILNSPMAVVIQEMVPADVAGVMFTCDPVTGNPANLTITANYGIGESVVSAAAEPDTLIYHRDADGLKSEAEVQIGKKSIQIVMSESGDGVVEEQIDQQLSAKCCVKEHHGRKLAELGILVEEVYGCPVDLEWGIKGDQFYLLQTRPITTFDKETDFEIAHELDSPLRSEEEYSSTANVGEVMPGAFSYLGSTAVTKTFELIMVNHFQKRGKHLFPYSPYFHRGMVMVQNHSFFGLFDSLLRFYHGEGEKSFITESQMIAMFGRILDDKEMLVRAAKRNAYYQETAMLPQVYYVLHDMMLANKTLNKMRKKFFNQTVTLPKDEPAGEAYNNLWRQILKLVKPTFVHSMCSITSSLYNNVLLGILVSENNKEWSPEVYRDFAYILSSCKDVESVDVPNAMDKLAFAIAECTDPAMFSKLPKEEALKWLQESTNKAGDEFRAFIDHHGHRCYKEFDLISIPWGDDPLSLVKTLQEMTPNAGVGKKPKELISTSETIRNLQTSISFKNKMLLRAVIPLCRKGVGMRERSKSFMIKIFDAMRKGYRQMGDIMVGEGRLPDAHLINFLTFEEIDYLIRTRSPKLIQKAIRRKQLFPAMDRLIYPEISKGIPKPVNYADNKPSEDVNLTMTGVAVSAGVAKGPARVATCLEEAASIQNGEILIAYSTDIGWSPYFPMLAGVATEIGGLISHGAVVAREYGLPCVVGLPGATFQFKTGDMVMLNGNKGILQRIQSDA